MFLKHHLWAAVRFRGDESGALPMLPGLPPTFLVPATQNRLFLASDKTAAPAEQPQAPYALQGGWQVLAGTLEVFSCHIAVGFSLGSPGRRGPLLVFRVGSSV